VPRRLNGRVDEAGADIVEVASVREVLADDFSEVRDDDAELAAALQSAVALSQEAMRFGLIPLVEVVLEVL